MKRFNLIVLTLSLFSSVFLTSCEEAENQIIGLWLLDSLQRNAYEDGEITATATEYYASDEIIYWEFQELELYFYEGRDMELEQIYSWVIEDGDVLVIYSDGSDEFEFDINNLSRKQLVLKDEQYRTDGDVLSVIETIYTLKREEE